jgi:hypothetical protein
MTGEQQRDDLVPQLDIVDLSERSIAGQHHRRERRRLCPLVVFRTLHQHSVQFVARGGQTALKVAVGEGAAT